MNTVTLKVKKLHEDAIIPTYATEGSACFDLYAIEEKRLLAQTTHSFKTGLSFQIPKHHVMLIYVRSGMAFKHGVTLVNNVGVIDSDYTGEVLIGLRKEIVHDSGAFVVKKGDRIAQAIVVPYPVSYFQLVDELDKTDRGEGGFGSTGI